MLTAAQKARCATLAQALDRGDGDSYTRVEPSLSNEERILIWDSRKDFSIWAERGRQMAAERSKQAQVATGGRGKKNLTPNSEASLPKRDTAMISVDPDYWPPVEAAEPTDDEPLDDDAPVCSACGGSGRSPGGDECAACRGKGRVVDDQDDEDKDDEFKDD